METMKIQFSHEGYYNESKQNNDNARLFYDIKKVAMVMIFSRSIHVLYSSDSN